MTQKILNAVAAVLLLTSCAGQSSHEKAIADFLQTDKRGTWTDMQFKVVAALVIARLKCKSAAASRVWMPTTISQKVKIDGFPALVISSQVVCPKEGGCIVASPTLWSAWGKQALTNLGHLFNFAFGFLAERGCGMMVTSGASAAEGLGSLASKEGIKAFAKGFGESFINTAKTNWQSSLIHLRSGIAAGYVMVSVGLFY